MKLWDLASAKERVTLDAHTLPVYAVAVPPDGKHPGDRRRRPSKAAAGRTVPVGPGGPARGARKARDVEQAVWSVAYSPDGSLLAASIVPGTIKIWDAKTGAGRQVLSAPSVRPVAFSPDGKLLATGHGGGIVGLWETATWKKITSWQGQKKVIFTVAFAPEGGTLASACQDGTVNLYSVSPAALAGPSGRVVPFLEEELPASALRSRRSGYPRRTQPFVHHHRRRPRPRRQPRTCPGYRCWNSWPCWSRWRCWVSVPGSLPPQAFSSTRKALTHSSLKSPEVHARGRAPAFLPLSRLRHQAQGPLLSLAGKKVRCPQCKKGR